MRKLDRLISRYEEFHQDETNRLVHFICVPLIALSLVGLLWCIKIPTTLGDELSFTLNAGRRIVVNVHGDDFTVTGPCNALDWYESKLQESYERTAQSRLFSTPLL